MNPVTRLLQSKRPTHRPPGSLTVAIKNIATPRLILEAVLRN